MRQYTMGLAQRATGRATDPLAPGPGPEAAVPAQERVAALHGVMTGLANLVNEQLGRQTIGPQATRFLRHLERVTFGNAGLHRRAGRSDPGLWCPYDHAAWAETLGMSSSALTHLRARLMEAEIIWYTPDPGRRGYGALGWSFDFASWKPLQWGGARPGAGRPRAAHSVKHRLETPLAGRAERTAARRGPEETPPGAHGHVVQTCRAPASDAADPMVITSTEPTNQDASEGETGQGRREFKMSTKGIQDVNETKSSRQRSQIKMSTARPAEPASPQASEARAGRGSLKKKKKERKMTDADVSGVASTPRVAPAAPGPLVACCSHALRAGSPERIATPPRAQPPPLPERSLRATPAGDPLPPPLPYETLRSYWLRIYREACAATGQEARPVVHAAGRALLNMGHERADYVLLGQLHQAVGTWATVLYWILEGAARELVDPRTYLRAIAARQHAGAPHRSQPGRQRGQPRPRPRQAGQSADPDDDLPVTAGWEPPDAPQAPAGQTDPDAGSSAGVTTLQFSPADSATAIEQNQQYRVPVRNSREAGSDDTAVGDAAAHASSRDAPNEPGARAPGVPDGAVDGAVASSYVTMAHLWLMAQQRLRAELTPAQYSSWLANTDLYRAPDGALVLVTRTTFAAELIARRWGKRIEWVLGDITGRACPLTVQMRRLDRAVPAR